MRARGHCALSALLVAALVAPGCAQVMTSTASERRVTARRPTVLRADGVVRATVSRDGFVARIRIERPTLCTPGQEVDGEDVITTTRAINPNSDQLTAWAYIALVVGGVVALAPFAKDETRDHWEPYAAVGGGIGAVGLGMLIPRLAAAASTGSSQQTRPFHVTQAEPGATPQECTTRPERAVLVFRADRAVLFEDRTDADGRLELNLAEALPTEAFRGEAPWPTLTVSTPTGGLLERIDLLPYQVALADAQWARLEASPTPEALERFAQDFPRFARAAEARERVPLLRRAQAALARDQEREAQWTAAGDDDARLEALSAEAVGDVYEAEAECRLAARSRDLADLRNNLPRCERRLAAMPATVRTRHPELLARAEAEAQQILARIASLEEAQRAAEARAREEREREEREAEARRERTARNAAAAARSALARARSIAGQCRSGGASGPSAARAAYEALSAARDHASASAVRALVLQVAVACRCTPACAGVPSP